MTRLVIARHGNTFGPGDIVTRVGGRTDLPLVASGLAQGVALGRHLASLGYSFAAAYCSPLQRTRQSAEAILAETGNAVDIETEAFLTEIDYGPDENRPEDEVRARIGEAALAAWEKEGRVPDGWLVDPDALQRAWKSFFARVAERWPGRDVLVVTSNGIARFALAACGTPADSPLKLRTGAYGEIVRDEVGAARLVAWDIRPLAD
jgi:probable phosphoglycerate mutase